MTYEEALKVCKKPQVVSSFKDDQKNYQGCRKCKKCEDRKTTDLAGRCMAEALVSDRVAALTLTYGDWTGPRAQYLDYRDVQLMIKRLRSDGYKFRYLVAGEYGAKRARAHWHMIFYFQGRSPQMPPVEQEKQNWKYWVDAKHNFSKTNGPEPLGFVYVQQPDYHGLRYVVKYATKDEGTGLSTRKPQMSKKPPLGAGYWPILARKEVSEGQPFRFNYTLPDCRYANGNAIEFYATRASGLLKWKAYRKAFYEIKENRTKACPVHQDAQRAWETTVYPDFVKGLISGTIKHDVRAGRYTYEKRLTVKRGEVYKLHTGDLVQIQRFKEGATVWPVKSLRDLLAVARGAKPQARKLRRGEIPF